MSIAVHLGKCRIQPRKQVARESKVSPPKGEEERGPMDSAQKEGREKGYSRRFTLSKHGGTRLKLHHGRDWSPKGCDSIGSKDLRVAAGLLALRPRCLSSLPSTS